MKKILIPIVLLLFVSQINAQTNSFPSTGNVGINTADLVGNLTIGEYGGSIALRDRTTLSSGTSSLGRLKFYDYFGEAANIALEHNYYFGGTPRAMLFSVNGAERIRIISNGNVGIGTNNPHASLHVNGNGLFNSNVKILASDGAWAEGVTIVKPTGWAGIRIARNDPLTGNYDGNWALGYSAGTGNDFTISNSVNNSQYDHIFHINGTTRNVGIGTATPSAKLSVNGNVRAKEIKVENSNWPDFVFTKSHKLPTLNEIEKYVEEKGHLPGIPSAEEVKANGIDLGEMNAKLLQKIEELTLHLIEMKKENDLIKESLSKQQVTMEEMKNKLK